MRTRIGISMVRKITRTNRTRIIVVTFEDRWLPSSRGSSGGSSKQPHWTSPPSSQAPCSTWNKGRMYSWSQRLCGDLLVAKQKASTLLSRCHFSFQPPITNRESLSTATAKLIRGAGIGGAYTFYSFSQDVTTKKNPRLVPDWLPA